MSAGSWSDERQAFRQAAQWYVATASSVRTRWENPALGVRTVRDLVGHTSRALMTVEAYLDVPTTTVDVQTAAEYYRLVMPLAGDGRDVAQRGGTPGVPWATIL